MPTYPVGGRRGLTRDTSSAGSSGGSVIGSSGGSAGMSGTIDPIAPIPAPTFYYDDYLGLWVAINDTANSSTYTLYQDQGKTETGRQHRDDISHRQFVSARSFRPRTLIHQAVRPAPVAVTKIPSIRTAPAAVLIRISIQMVPKIRVAARRLPAGTIRGQAAPTMPTNRISI